MRLQSLQRQSCRFENPCAYLFFPSSSTVCPYVLIVCFLVKVVNVSSFEKHAGSNARHPSDYIFLENGKSLQEYIKSGSQPGQAKVTGVIRKATNEENSERNSFRSGSTRSVSAHRKRGSFPNAGCH